MSKMTPTELQSLIKEVTLPLIKDFAGNQVKEIVAEAIAKQIEGNGAGKQMLTGVNGEEGTQPSKTWKESGYSEQYYGYPNVAKTAHDFPPHYGLGFGRCVRAMAKSRMDGNGYKAVPKILADWGDKASAKFYEEKALAASDAVSGGFLVPPQFSQEIIEFLRPASVVRKLGPVIIPMPTGTFRIPKMTVGSTFTYQGENTNAGKTQPQFGNVTLTFKKLSGVVPISNDLMRYSSPGADAIVRDDMVNGIADAENRNFLRGDGTAATPVGLLNWCLAANNFAANQTSNLANITADLGAMIVRLMNNNIKMIKPGWIWAPRTWNFLMTLQTTNGVFPFRDELMRGTFWGWPYGTTTAVPINIAKTSSASSEIYLVDFADAAIGEALNMTIDASQEAAYWDGSSVISAFSQDQTVIRAISEHDFVMRRAESIAVLNSVVYF